ncbi:6-bladed beta-propeller [Bacteroides heparinolyticus]|uniref:6-bladed beta-propeller n=1 Tax=Prevotella heparinolytica TaxID=28113 RepID=UPI000D04801F|nr:6-bladed beta-propeller [Bacteroides heparinolyticus]AVM58335.1 6-bladed beta-propeller [Bacteroides heparinolyticus]
MFRSLCLTLVLSIILVACKNKEKVNFVISDGMKEVCSVNTFSKTLDMGEYVDSLSFISLEDSKEEALLKDINKCIIKNGRIYVLDFFGTESVKVFDLSGRFLFMVGSKGGGPGEFFRTFDFDVNDHGIFLLDIRNKKIIEYNLDGSFREEYSYIGKFSGINSFVVTNESTFLLGMDGSIYTEAKVLLVDKQYNIIHKILPFQETDTKGQLKIGSFRRCGNNIVYHYPISDEIFLFEQSGKLANRYILSLNDTPIPDDIRMDYRNVVSERKFGGFNYFHETPFFNGRMFLATMFYGSNKALFCLDIKTGKYMIKSYEGVLNFFSKLTIRDFNFPVFMDENQIVCVLNLMIYDNVQEKDVIPSSFLKKMNEGGTVLLVYHLKKK